MIKRNYKITSKFLLIVGVVFLVVGIIFSILNEDQIERDTVSATATVVDYVEDTEIQLRLMQTVYYPVVTYEVDGKNIQSQYSKDYDEKVYNIGDTIEIKYNPDEPEEFIIVGDIDDTHFDSSWAIALGAVLIVLGIVKFVFELIKGKK